MFDFLELTIGEPAKSRNFLVLRAVYGGTIIRKTKFRSFFSSEMQKCYRKVPDTSPQASKKYIFVHQISIFLKENCENTGEKNREKKSK